MKQAARALLILLAGGWAYAAALGGGWLWDDNLYITQNPLLRSPAGLGRIWFGFQGVNYFPLTATVQWAQWQLWGDHPWGYHATNLALHLASAFLFWRLLEKFGLRQGWLGGLLFAVHPVAVESVAWVSELKNTLSLPLLLLALADFVDYEQAGGRRSYRRSLFWFVAAMLSKSTVAMFPFVLLLYLGWKRGRVRRADLRASAPFFAISAALGALTVWIEHRQMTSHVYRSAPDLVSRLGRAGAAMVFYLAKAVFPAALRPIYPAWPSGLPGWGPWLALAGFFFWLFSSRHAWASPARFGFGWLVCAIAPVAGLIAMAYLRIAPVADHFAYVALLGPIGLAVAAWEAWMRRGGAAVPAGWITLAAAVAALACETQAYGRVFTSQDRLWTNALDREPESWIAHFYLANVRREEGKGEAAIGEYRRALELEPTALDVQDNLGVALAEAGRPAEAIAQYELALRQDPDFPDAHSNLGLALVKSGRTADGLAHLERAADLEPEKLEVQVNFGLALAMTGHPGEAAGPIGRALRIDPGSAVAHDTMGVALAVAGRWDEAAAQYREAIRLQPDLADAHGNLATALTASGHLPEAIGEYRAVLRLNPRLADAYYNLGNALVETGRPAEAVPEFVQALRLNPRDAGVHHNLGVALRALGRSDEAREQFAEEARLQR